MNRPIRKILVPADAKGSISSQRAFEIAAQVCRADREEARTPAGAARQKQSLAKARQKYLGKF